MICSEGAMNTRCNNGSGGEFSSPALSWRLVSRGHPALRVDLSEVECPPIPELGLLGIAAGAVHPGTVEKGRIEGQRHPHRRTAVAGIGGALKEEPSRSDIPGGKKGVAPRHESGDLFSRQLGSGGRPRSRQIRR
jgi:hypothetical protein